MARHSSICVWRKVKLLIISVCNFQHPHTHAYACTGTKIISCCIYFFQVISHSKMVGKEEGKKFSHAARRELFGCDVTEAQYSSAFIIIGIVWKKLI